MGMGTITDLVALLSLDDSLTTPLSDAERYEAIRKVRKRIREIGDTTPFHCSGEAHYSRMDYDRVRALTEYER